MSVVISAFYKFVRIADTTVLRGRLRAEMQARGMRGTILIAPEGLNGTVSADAQAMSEFLALLRTDPRFQDVVIKQATREAHPFKRLKVKLKKEIITFPFAGADPQACVGTYVTPENWNALITSPDVLVLDTRNAYEVEVGTFQGAVDPKVRTFTQFAEFVGSNLDPERHRKVAMFCTGGIRCEKASAYMLSQGFAEVYHLQGGILNYLEKVPPEKSLWQGACFVFDERGAVSAKE